MRILLAIILISIAGQGFSQMVVLRGSVFDSDIGEPLPFTSISIGDCSSVSDNNGEFEMRIPSPDKNDTLKLRFLSYYDINFIHLPGSIDTITLDKIPFFEYFRGASMADFFCRWYNFKCKRNQRRHMQEEKILDQEYYMVRDSIIRSSNNEYLGNIYKIDIDNHCVDLAKPIDK